MLTSGFRSEWRMLSKKVHQFMAEAKVKRIKKERAALIRVRVGYLKNALEQHQYVKWDHNAKDRVYVQPGDCLWMPEIRAIIEDTSEEATKEDFIAVFTDVLPGLTSRWVNERRAEYTARLAKALGDSEGMKVSDPLDLAIASFSCSECRGRVPFDGHDMRWTEILQHRCLFSKPHHDDSSTANYKGCDRSDLRHYDPPLAERIFHYSGDMASLREVIKVCGRDPETVTYRELDACGVRLRCLLCAMLSRQETFDWKAAVSYCCATRVSVWQLTSMPSSIPDST